MECVYVEEARYVEDFTLFVRFNDGKAGKVDLEDVVNRYSIAASLRDPKVFSQFYLDSWPTVAWSCGFDVAPETLYERCGL